ncbi:arsenic resistance protein [Microbacterium sp.]|jgi:arsenite transporter|uniref:arsenic resistance protein n=1 Tax=Microbacterium sp. TaxID=51671 RepID=UPI0025FB2D54|nr:arsenic resistance protein [Microbacterium sp.]MBT9607764.1 arsenic resistance protein [Microbacterium sp.]
MTTCADRRQIPLSVSGMLVGAAIGLLAPRTAPVFEALVGPALVLLLFATFLAVPFADVRRSLGDLRFVSAALVLSFVLVPVVVFGLSRFVAHDRALLVGVLLVLLTPCVDYVIVFTRLAGGAAAKLLAVSPVLMLLQLVLLPVYLGMMAGLDVLEMVDAGPFVQAFVLFIALPLGLAAFAQFLARRFALARRVEKTMDAGTAPIMTATLAVIVAAQVDVVRAHASALLGLVPIYVAFLAIAAALGLVVARVLCQGVASSRALMFSAATRNSLVILPLALALPAPLAPAAAAVVTQTLVELVGMLVMVRVVPRLARRERLVPD